MKLVLPLFSFLKIRKTFLLTSISHDSSKTENHTFIKAIVPAFILIFFLSGSSAFAQTVGDYRSNANSGTWSTLNDWQRLNALPNTWAVPTAGQGYPGQLAVPAVVTILDTDGISLNVSPANNIGSLVMEGGNSTSTLTFTGTNSLTVNGVITINGGGNGGTDEKSVNVGGGTLSCASVTMGAPTSTNLVRLTISTGTVTVGGTITMTANNSVTFTANGTLFISSTGTMTGGSLAPSTGTVNYSGTTQAVGDYNYNNLTLSGSNEKTWTFGGNRTVGGVLTVTNGSTLTTASNNTLGVTGVTGISGTINLGGTGTKTFSNNVTVNSPSGNWNETGIATISFAGSLANNATFTANTGAHNFTGTGQTVSGSALISIPTATFAGTYTNSGTFTSATALTVNGAFTNSGTVTATTLLTVATGITLTNNGTVTATTALSGLGGVTQGTTGVLNIGGTSGITTLTASAIGNTVNYNGAGAQTVIAVNYQNLTLSNSGAKTLQVGTTAIGGNLDISGTASATAVAALTVTGNVTLGTGTTFSASTFTHNVAGNWTNNGATFNANTSTINFNGTTQSIGGSSGTTFNNIILANSGNKTIATALTIGANLSISGTAIALLANSTISTANTLTIGGGGTVNGSWGGTASAATNKNATYFGTTTDGICNVALSTCIAPDVSNFAATSATDVCTGSGSVVTITSSTLTNGASYTVYYDVSGTNTVTTTSASMTFGAGTGTFTTASLSTAGGSNVVNVTAIALSSTPACTSPVSSSTPAFTTKVRPSPTFTTQPGASFCLNADATYTTQSGSGETNYVWSVPGVLNTNYSITSGGVSSADATVTLKWLTTGSKTVTINYTNSVGCTASSATSSTATTVNAVPSITAASAATVVCFNAGSQTSRLTYSATTGSPTTYSIDYVSGLFTDVVNSALPASPITLTVPAGLAAGSYTANLTVSNGTCTSTTSTITINVISSISTTAISSATASQSCSGSGILITVNSSSLSSGTYTVTYNMTSSSPGTQTLPGQTATLTFSSSTGKGTFTTTSILGSSTVSVTITSLGAGVSLTCSTALAPAVVINNIVYEAPNPSGFSYTATTTDTANPNGATVNINASGNAISAGTYTVSFSITGPVSSSGTALMTLASSRKGNKYVGSFTTGQLSTVGTYTITINSIAYFPATGCIDNTGLGSPASFSVLGTLATIATGNYHNGQAVWGGSAGSIGPDFNSGSIAISAGHIVTLDGSIAASDTLKLDQFTIYGTLIIKGDEILQILDRVASTDITIGPSGQLIIDVPLSPATVGGTLIFKGDVTHSNTLASNVTFNASSVYKHQATTTEGSPPMATWSPASTFNVEGYTTASLTFASSTWSQNFANFTWNCPNQTGTIDLNGLLGASPLTLGTLQGNVNITSTGTAGTGILRFSQSENGAGTDYVLTIPGTLTVSNAARFASGKTSGNGPDAIINLGNFTYSSSGTSWFCDAGQTTVNVSGNVQINGPGIFYFSDGGGNRSGTTMNLAGDLTVGSGATLAASSSNNLRAGTLIFNNLPLSNAAKTHLYTVDGAVTGWMIYQIVGLQTVRAVNESAFISTGTTTLGIFTMASTSTLIVESNAAAGALQPDVVPGTTRPSGGNIQILNAACAFANGSTIEYSRVAASAQFINGLGHPVTPGVNCRINNTVSVVAGSTPTAGPVTISGVLTLQAGTLTVTNNDLTVTGATTLENGTLALNSTGQATGRNVTLTGTVSRALTGATGTITITSPATDAQNANINFNGDFSGSAFLSFVPNTFTNNNCNVTIGGSSTATNTFPISGASFLESLTMNRPNTVTTILNIPQALTVGANNSNLTNGLFITSGTLAFKGQSLTLKGEISTTTTGFLSSDEFSSLTIDGSYTGANNNLYFSSNGKAIGTVKLDRTPNQTFKLQTDLDLWTLLDMNLPATFKSLDLINAPVAAGLLTIRSRGNTTNLDGRIGPIPSGGSVLGNVKVERYMASVGGEKYRYVSSAVPNAPMPTELWRLYYYANNQWNKYYGIMNPGVGYAALTSFAGAAWSVTGTIGQGDNGGVGNIITLNPGWNLVGNPFPSPIQWPITIADRDVNKWEVVWGVVSAVVGITDNDITGYPNYFRYWDSATPGGGSFSWGSGEIGDLDSSNGNTDGNGVIATGQAFWMHSSSSSDITIKIKEAAKLPAISSSVSKFYRTKSESSAKELLIRIDDGQIGDQAMLKIKDSYSKQLPNQMDLPKLWNEEMNVYLIENTKREMLIQTISALSETLKIPVGIKVAKPGEYEISFTNSEAFNYPLYLIDLDEAMSIPVSEGQRYKISIKDASKPINDRFYLSLSPDFVNKETTVSVYPNPVTDQLNISIKGQKSPAQITLVDMSGKVLRTAEIKREGSIDVSDFKGGFYILKVKTEHGIFVQKIVKHD